MVLCASRPGVLAGVRRGDREAARRRASPGPWTQPRRDARPGSARRLISRGPREGPADRAGNPEHGEGGEDGSGDVLRVEDAPDPGHAAHLAAVVPARLVAAA